MHNISFIFEDINNYPDQSSLKDNYLIVKYENNNYMIYLDESFLPDNTNLEEKSILTNILGFLTYNKDYCNYFGFKGDYSNENENFANNKLWETNIKNDFHKKMEEFKKKYFFTITEGIKHYLLTQPNEIKDTTILQNPLFYPLLDILQSKYDIKLEHIPNHYLTKELIKNLNDLKKTLFNNNKILSSNNGNINYKSSFQLIQKDKELKGHFFELLCHQVLFRNENYNVLADWSSINIRKKGNIYPDIIAISTSKREKKIIIMDGKYYKYAHKVSAKEVFMNHIVIKDLVKEDIPIYNFAIVPKKMDKAFNIERIEKIYETHVIIIELDIFKSFNDINTLEQMINESNIIMNNPHHSKLIKPQIEHNMKLFIQQNI